MAASYRSTDWFPSTGSSLHALNMLESDMVERLTTDKSVLQDQDTISTRPLCGNNAFSASSCGFNTESFHFGGYENAADTPRSYHSHTDILSFEKGSHGKKNEMFYHGNGLPSEFQRSSNSTRNQSSLQHYGDLYVDDSRHFIPFDSSNQQYPAPEHSHVSPEFHMFQENSRHFDRHAHERNSSETDYMMRSTRHFGLRNNIYGEPRGLNLNLFSGEKMFHPTASTRTCMHIGSAELSTNVLDMGPPHGVWHDALESAASVSYREQVYNRCKRGSFSGSSLSPTWEFDYNLPLLDEARSGSYNDFCHSPAMLDMLTERNRGPRASSLHGKSKMMTYGHADHFCQQDQSQFRDAKFFVIKSYSEDNVHKSIKYCVWASTKNGNKKLDTAYREATKKEVACPVFLLFSVNASAQFCGVAEMVGPVDFNTSVEYWQQDRWSGHFPVKWLIVKDVPNSLFRHIIIETNDNKPVTNSRDTQEVGLEEGIEMLNIFKSCEMRSSILDDFSFYEERQGAIQDRKARQRVVLENLARSPTSFPTHPTSSLHDDFVREMSKSFAEALALQHRPK